MKWFNNLKVAMKVLLSSLVFVLLIFVVAFQGIRLGQSAEEAFVRFYDAEFMPVR